MTDGIISTTIEQLTIGDRIARIVNDVNYLYDATGVEYFKSQASSWSQWVWMLQDSKRLEWKVSYVGDAHGAQTNTVSVRGGTNTREVGYK
jgi:hypothetical protein